MANSQESIEIEYLEVQTGIDPIASIIWLHGLGADGHDFEPIVPELKIPEDMPVRFIFPHAPVRAITINGGMRMRGWYDLKSMTFDREEDREGFDESSNLVINLIDQELDRGIDSSKIILAGFSQGGAVALYTGLRYPKPLAGIIALSTYLPFAVETATERHGANNGTDIFMAHGVADPIIPLLLADQSQQHLQSLEYPLNWSTYNMEHSLHMDEILAISEFIQENLR